MRLKEKQKDILSIAIQLFNEKGFVGTSMRDIAAQLHIKAASLYSHIQSKEELLKWICFDIADQFFEGLKTVKEASLPPEEKLNLFIEKHLETVFSNPDVTNIYSTEWKHLEESLAHFITLRKNYEKQVENLLEEIYLEMEKPLKSKKFTSRFLLHTLNNSVYWFNREEKDNSKMIAEIKEKVLFGLLGK